MSRLKSILGIALMCMAMGELATGFYAYPAVCEFANSRTEWWAQYLPPALLLNALAATVLMGYCGIKLMKENSFFTERQDQWFDRWLEKRRYGYCKADYVIKEGDKTHD